MAIVATSSQMGGVSADVEQVDPHNVALCAFPHAVEFLLVNRGEEHSLHRRQAAGIRRFLRHFHTSFLLSNE